MRILLCLVAFALLAGCSDPPRPRAHPTHTPTPAKRRTPSPRRTKAPAQVKNVVLSDHRGAGESQESFASDTEALYLAYTPQDVPSGTMVRCAWSSQDLSVHTVDSQQCGKERDTFSLERPGSAWAPGNYTVQLYLGPQVAETINFTIEAAETSTPVPEDTPVEVDTPSSTPEIEGTPPTANSMAELAARLKRKSERETAYAIYRWLAENVRYDVAAFNSGDYGDQSAETVLRNKAGVCEGYANLYKALCELNGLSCELVAGYSKADHSHPGAGLDKPNHAWNAVQIDGKYVLLDVTWGAGSVKGDAFLRQVNDYWFNTPPEQFLYSHLPEEGRWQLRKPEISLAEFARRPELTPVFFKEQVKLVSHTEGSLGSERETRVTIELPAKTLVASRLMQGDNELPKNLSMVTRQGDRATVFARFPKPGDYRLTIFAGSNPSHLDQALSYEIKARSGGGKEWSYPSTFGAFSSNGVELKGPWDGTLAAGSKKHFALRAPGALRMMVETTKGRHNLGKRGDLFEGDVPVAEGNMTVFAAYDQLHWNGLLEYSGR